MDGLIYIYCEMINTLGLANIHLSYNKKGTIFSPCDENLQDLLGTTVLCSIQLHMLAIFITLYIVALVLSYLASGSLYLLTTCLQLPPPPTLYV